MTGPPGSGKTWYAVRKIAVSLHQGKMVATNVKLHDGWAMEVANMAWITRLFKGKAGVERLAREYERRVFVSADLTELFAIRLAPCRKCKQCKCGRACQTEGRGVMVLDEAHEWLNARFWEKDDRQSIVKFFAVHRKLGWDVYLITQGKNRIDNQVRDNFEYDVRLKNMRKFKPFGWMPIPFTPFNLFVAVTYWHGSGGERVSVDMYRLTKLADVYDTMARPELFESDNEEGVIALPLTHEEVAQRKDGTWRAPELVANARPDEAAGTGFSPGRPSVRPRGGNE